MSRVGKKPVTLPSGVKAELKDKQLVVSGPKGSLTMAVHPQVSIAVSESEVTVDVAGKTVKKERSLWGTSRALIQNMVDGVTKGFEKKLEVNGVGFKVAQTGQKLTFNLGFSHPINVEIPKGLAVSVDKNIIVINGNDRQQVGQFAAEIRDLKKPEPYKGKGIKYSDETILRKAGKVVKAVGGGK